MKKSLIREIATTWELCGGRELSDMAQQIITEALEGYSQENIRRALARCQSECRGYISLADIIQRIDDGRPGLEEAWAMIPRTEDESTVWTAEMAAAYGIIKGMMDEPLSARMAFKEAYQRICGEARAARRHVEWIYSPGFDETLRSKALIEAVEKGRFTADRALELAPHLVEDELKERGLLPAADVPKLEAPKDPKDDAEYVPPEKIKAFLENLSEALDLKESSDRERRRAEKEALNRR